MDAVQLIKYTWPAQKPFGLPLPDHNPLSFRFYLFTFLVVLGPHTH
jgi:hypothetical protein